MPDFGLGMRLADVIALQGSLRNNLEVHCFSLTNSFKNGPIDCAINRRRRFSPDLHQRISLAATLSGKSLNAWVTEQLASGVQQTGKKAKVQRTKGRPKSTKQQRVSTPSRA